MSLTTPHTSSKLRRSIFQANILHTGRITYTKQAEIKEKKKQKKKEHLIQERGHRIKIKSIEVELIQNWNTKN